MMMLSMPIGSNTSKKQNGFTLIEIMIAVAIVAIIAAVALPSYQEQVRKSRRSDAKIGLEKAAALQEQHRFTNNTYSSDVNDIGGQLGTLLSPEGNYTITTTITAANTGCTTDGFCFLLTATARGVQADDTDCSTFTLTNTGVKTSTSNRCDW